MSTVIAGLALLISVFALFVAIRASRASKVVRTNTLMLNKKIIKTQSELKSNFSTLTGMGQRILDTQNKLELLQDKLTQQDFYDKREQNYRQADKMIALGGGEEDIKECGLTTAEARLMKILKAK